MSRTIRRKAFKQPYIHYEDEEQFELIKALYEAGNPQPPPSLDRTKRFWARNAPEWENYYSAMYFLHYSHSQPTYGAFVKSEDARFHSDNGRGHRWAKRAPGDVERTMFQKPLRLGSKLAIKHGITYDSWDEILFPLYIGTAGTWWLWD